MEGQGLSTIHTISMVTIEISQGSKKKQQIVLDYNPTSGGVDCVDNVYLQT